MPDAFMPDVFVEVAFNAGYTTAATLRRWTDVSEYVELADGITIDFGRQDEQSDASANVAKVTLDNTDGRFTAGRAASPYYPNVKVGRPLRVSAIMPGAASIGPSNPGAEVNTAGWSGFGGASIARSTTRAYEGTASFLATWPTVAAEQSSVYHTVSGLTVGEWYRYEAYVWVPASQPRVILKCREWKSLPSTTTDAWERLHVVFKADATSRDIEVKHFDAATAGQTCYFDALTVKLTLIRFVGFVDEWPVEWDGTDRYAKAPIRAASRLSRLGLSAKLKSTPELEIRRGNPIRYWPLGDASGSTSAVETSGNYGAPLESYDYTTVGGDAPVVFGNATGPFTDGITAAQFSGANPDAATALALETRQVFGDLSSSVMRGIRCTLLITALPPTLTSFPLIVQSGSASIGFRYTSTGIIQTTGGSATLTGSNLADGGTHDLALLWDATTAYLIVDGVVVDTDSSAGFPSSGAITRVIVGNTVSGVISHVAIFDASGSITSTLATAQATALLTGYAGERTDQRAVRILGWAGVPSSEVTAETGVETMQWRLTAGMGVLDALRECESTEGGVLFDDRDGSVAFHNRSHRYTQTPAVTLNMASQHVGQDYVPRVDRSELINEVEVENPAWEQSLIVVDEASAAEYGPATTTVTAVTMTPTGGALERGQWLLAKFAEPRTRVPSLTVDVLAHQGLTPTAQALLEVTMGDLIEVTNAPSQSDTTTPSYFVEGGTEVIGPELYEISFNLSPGSPAAEVLILDSATRGLLDTNRLGY